MLTDTQLGMLLGVYLDRIKNTIDMQPSPKARVKIIRILEIAREATTLIESFEMELTIEKDKEND